MRPWILLAYVELKNAPGMQWTDVYEREGSTSTGKQCQMCKATYLEGERIPDLRLCCILGQYKSYHTSDKGWSVPVVYSLIPDISERMVEHWLHYLLLCYESQYKDGDQVSAMIDIPS